MTLQLVDDDQVLEAALSFLEQHDTQHSARGKKKNTSSSNRAREAQYKELLALREQVPRLEKHLTELQEQAQPSVLHLWRKLAMLERQSRANAEDENCRLRALVSSPFSLEASVRDLPTYAQVAETMTLLFAEGSKTTELSDARLREIVRETLQKLETQRGTKFERAVIVPPDFTRFHSKSGVLSQYAYEYLQDKVTDVLPALGTHDAMTDEEITKMFGDIPKDIFRVHDWRNDVVTIGQVPAELIREASDGKVNEPWPAQINKLLWEGGHDLVLSIGQVVPHEVMGMANFNKNIFVGTGGSEGINFSHFIGAVYGMERMMGRADNPLRRILNYASTHFLQKLPLIYIQTVIGRGENGDLVTRGVFIGDDEECFMKAAELSLEVNFELLEAPIDKVVVYLDPEEFKSTWLGNKSIYRTRMAIADDGELIVLAPGVARFGEDKRIDELIRKYGYRTTPEVLAHLNANRDLMKNLSAAAHLIHGSSEGRFRITYCPGHLTKEEVEGVGFGFGDLKEMSAKYPIDKLQDGWNVDADGEKFFYISNPALGLWAYRGRFEGSSQPATSATSTAASATSLSAAADTTEACLDAGVGGGPFKHT
ncbi:hypothetical protein PF002_g6715 [Phytophthora fragariae]|uniref:LarA-like N-terminal domain-containing protein n=2 Tax=Phytophthora fragariae TaxID=53985 RepID=A0A6A4A017_9STRA|nr:hypothetical protein PF002_g6715 [Phytophthora fragariae]